MNNFEKIQNLLKDEYDKLEIKDKKNNNGIKYEPKDIFIDKATIEIIKSYNKRNNSDIQLELRKYLEPTFLEKLRLSLKNNKDIKIEERNKLDKVINAKGINLNEEEKEKVEDELEKNNDNLLQTDENELRKVSLKVMYKSVLEEYYNLKQNIQENGFNSQISTGNLVSNEKIGTELILYEKYLKDIDNRYSQISKTSVIRDDDEIKEIEKNLALNDEKSEKYILNRNEENIIDVKNLFERRNEIAEEISTLSLELDNKSDEKFTAQMDRLQKEYMQVSKKIYALTPNPLQINQNINQLNEEERYRQHQLGQNYQTQHLRDLGGSVAVKSEVNDGKLENNIDNFNYQVQDSNNMQEKNLEVILQKYEEAEDRGNYKKAEELLQSLEKMSGIISEEVTEVRNEESGKKTPDEVQKSEEKKDISNNLFDPRLAAINNDDEISDIQINKEKRKRRILAVKEKINLRDDGKVALENDEYIPTLQNNKRRF